LDSKNNFINKEPSIEELRNSLSKLNNEVVKDITSYVLKTYVIDKGVNFENITYENKTTEQQPASSSAGNDILLSSASQNFSTFTELMADIKSKYSFPELSLFSVENGSVFLNINGNKQEIKIQAQSYDATPRNVPPKKNETQPGNKNSNDENPHRFRNLEMDN
jgi:hypothetical protein